MVGEIGRPPEGVDVETYAIAKIDPTELQDAIKHASPSHGELVQYKDERPELYQVIDEKPQPDMALGNMIAWKQHRLARAKRFTATVLATVVAGTGMAGLTYETKESIRKNNPGIVREDPDRKDQTITSIGAGGIGGVASGLIVYLSSMGLSHRMARRPAERIVREARQAEAE